MSALGLDGEAAGPLLELARREYAVPVRVRADAGVSMVAGQFFRHVAGGASGAVVLCGDDPGAAADGGLRAAAAGEP